MIIAVHSSYAYIQRVNNYGSLLQYFALQVFLERMGHEVFWLRIALEKKVPTGINKWFREKILHSNFRLSEIQYHNHEGFKAFIHRYIHLSQFEYKKYKELTENKPEADLFIVGSDQVWNGYSKERYLNYVSTNTNKISYAVSFGRHNIPWYMHPLLYYYLKGFKAISVREQIGVDICNKLGRKDAVHTIDPSFLLNKEDYETILKNEDSIMPVLGSYIYGYFVNPFPENKLCFKNEIINFTNENKAQFIVTGIQNAELALSGLEQIQPTPLEWISKILHAKAVLTNSFHGIAFSINLNIPFLFLPQEGSMSNQNGRHLDILRMAGLEDRVFNPGKGSMGKQMSATIDWETVNNKIDVFRKESINFLMNQLGHINREYK